MCISGAAYEGLCEPGESLWRKSGLWLCGSAFASLLPGLEACEHAAEWLEGCCSERVLVLSQAQLGMGLRENSPLEKVWSLGVN